MKKTFDNNAIQGKTMNKGNLKVIANEDIKAENVQIISSSGDNLGILKLSDALSMAQLENLDLVMVSETSVNNVPVVKLINLKKKLYEDKKKLNQAKKRQHEVQIKELRISIKIGENDLRIKMKQASNFLLDGMKIKIVLVLKGRERASKDTIGIGIFNKAEFMLKEMIESSSKVLTKEADMDSALGWYKIFYLKKQ